jgi:membrane protein
MRPTIGNAMAHHQQKPGVKRSHSFRRILRLRFQDLGALLREAASEWHSDNVPRLGAALAFYTLLSLAPLLVVIVAIAAFAFGRKAAEGQLAWEIQGLVGLDQARAIQAMIRASVRPQAGAIAALTSILTLILGATGVVVELQDSLNHIWHVPASTRFAGIRGLLRQRVYSFVMVLAIGFLLLASLVVSAWIAATGKFFGSMAPFHESNLHLLTALVSFVVITFLFAAIYKVMPDVQLQWSDVLVGASVTSLTFTVGKQLIGLYLGKAGVGSSYGAAGSLVAVLVWVYYSAQLFFFGAEFTKVYARKYGSQFAAKLEPIVSNPGSGIATP